MNNNSDVTTVTFYIDTDKSIMAYFPNDEWNLKGDKTSYSHIGQHSPCDPEYVKNLKKATKKQYADLANELTSIGYKLEITN